MSLKRDSRRLSYLLRHHPEQAGCQIDESGWVNVNDLLRGTGWTLTELQNIVANNTRFCFSDDGTKIRAFHGHSKPVHYRNEKTPPPVLYHGTSKTNYEKIMESGYIRSMYRAQVHLSIDEDKAREIGNRHVHSADNYPVVLVIDCRAMQGDGYIFFDSDDGVWLTDHIPTRYIQEVRR